MPLLPIRLQVDYLGVRRPACNICNKLGIRGVIGKAAGEWSDRFVTAGVPHGPTTGQKELEILG
jgi:hypothetical protein